MQEFTPIEKLTLGIPGAGRRTLLAALPEDLCCPANFRLCVLDAARLDAPAQIALLDELAADPGLEIFFALNKADRPSATQNAVNSAMALLRERGFAQPRLWPVCAAAARLFSLSPEDQELPPRKITAQAEFFQRFAPGKNSLSSLSVTEAEPVRLLDGRELNPELLRLARINTGVPALEAAIRVLEFQGQQSECGSGFGVQDSEPAEAALGRQPGAEAPEEAPAPIGRQPEAEAPEEAAAPAQTATFTDSLEEQIDTLLDVLDAGGAPIAEPVVDLAPLREQMEKADCAALVEMARSIQNGSDPAPYREQALDALHAAYQARELEELEAMTEGVEELELPALRNLVDRINNGAYTVQARTPFAQRVNRRIDALMDENLSALCEGVEEADAQTLTKIRQSVDRADCADVLKSDYYRRIEARQEQLDVENLERVTAGVETMSEKELRTVAVTLEANNWNPKFVTAYRHKVALRREIVVFRELEQELADLNDMERREVLSLRERIAGKELAPRFTAGPLEQIDERLYRMDMLRLMALNNDFDMLDFEGLDNLRAQVGRGDYTPRARAEYLGRLREREEALVVENTDARAQLARQLIGQHKLRMADFTFAGRTELYRGKLEAFWGGSGMEQPRDIPVFLFDNGSDYAFTGERFYYKAGKELAFLPIADLQRFQTMRQHMSLLLQVVRKDNTYLLTEAKISRSGSERTVDFLNDCLRRWNEPELIGARSASPIRTRRFEATDYTEPVESCLPDVAMALTLFRRRYDGERLREGNLFRPGDETWGAKAARLLAGLGLPETTPLIWYDATVLLGSFREGVAVGPRAIYWKDSKLPLQTVPLEDIYSMDRNGKRMTITTLRGQSFQVEMPAVMIPLVEDYVRTIQLGKCLRSREEQA
ncbi:MAG: hypothetical protein J5789_01315 [Oscillospiraceae bacterium]|nr:hypothetical protein [Oscillospiraceae bacterium]